VSYNGDEWNEFVIFDMDNKERYIKVKELFEEGQQLMGLSASNKAKENYDNLFITISFRKK
jgi:hypothetical protein